MSKCDATRLLSLYTHSGQVSLNVPEALQTIGCSLESKEADVDRVFSALEGPVKFPPVREAIIADDNIAIACSANVPQASQLLAITVCYFLREGIEPHRISVVLSPNCSFDQKKFFAAIHENFQAMGVDEVSNQAAIDLIQIIYPPFSQDDLAYLAADKKANPIYVHRKLLEADFLLPVTQLNSGYDLSSAYVGGLLPAFTDEATLQRWNRERIANSFELEISKYSQELQWLLGLHSVMYLTSDWCNSDGGIQVAPPQLLAGNESNRKDVLPLHSEREFDLIVCELDLRETVTSWDSIAVALNTCAQLLNGRGRIMAVCNCLPTLTADFANIDQLVENDGHQDSLKHSSDPNLPALAVISNVLAEHSVFIFEAQPIGDRELPWEQLHTLQQCEQLILSSSSPAVVLSASIAATMRTSLRVV